MHWFQVAVFVSKQRLEVEQYPQELYMSVFRFGKAVEEEVLELAQIPTNYSLGLAFEHLTNVAIPVLILGFVPFAAKESEGQTRYRFVFVVEIENLEIARKRPE